MSGKLKNNGFWLALGLAVGGMALNVLQVQKLEAVGTSATTEGITLATGAANQNNVEILWILDEKGALSAMLVDNTVQMAPALDLREVFGKGGGKKPKYAMVTGRLQANGQLSDVLYVTESAAREIAVINIDPASGRLRVATKSRFR